MKLKTVITTNEDGICIAVTEQDEEGKVVSVVWEMGDEVAKRLEQYENAYYDWLYREE